MVTQGQLTHPAYHALAPNFNLYLPQDVLVHPLTKDLRHGTQASIFARAEDAARKKGDYHVAPAGGKCRSYNIIMLKNRLMTISLE